MKRLILILTCASLATPVLAQDVVVMRRSVAHPQPQENQQPTGTWVVGQYGDWSSQECGASSSRTRQDVCVNESGLSIDRSRCDSSLPHDHFETVEWTESCTYSPVYSENYGPCANGRQSASIVQCLRSDGEGVELSMCGEDRQTTERSCTTKCGPLVGYQYPFFTNPGNPQTHIRLAENVQTLEAAQRVCETKASSSSDGAICAWSSNFYTVWWKPLTEYEMGARPEEPNVHGAMCQ